MGGLVAFYFIKIVKELHHDTFTFEIGVQGVGIGLKGHNFFELNEDATYSKPVEVDLQKLLNSQGKIVDLLELTLGANLPLTDMKRLNWTTTDNEPSYWNVTSKYFVFISSRSRLNFSVT